MYFYAYRWVSMVGLKLRSREPRHRVRGALPEASGRSKRRGIIRHNGALRQDSDDSKERCTTIKPTLLTPCKGSGANSSECRTRRQF